MRSTLRKEQRHDKSNTPVGPLTWRLEVVACAACETDCLGADPRDLRVEEIQRHGPFLAVPVVGRFEVDRERARARKLLREERLQKRVADFGAVTVTGDRPDVIRENAVGPAV